MRSVTHVEDSVDPAKRRLEGSCCKEIRASIPATVSSASSDRVVLLPADIFDAIKVVCNLGDCCCNDRLV